ncbi:MAG: hypothetical protein WDM92_12070 [Caulobacteraceae bacterium]
MTFVRELTGPAFETRRRGRGRLRPAPGCPGPRDRAGGPLLRPRRGGAGAGQARGPGRAGLRGGPSLAPAAAAGEDGVAAVDRLLAHRRPLGRDRSGRAGADRAAHGGEALDPTVLRAMAGQPLRPVKPQQPLDIGLFEVRPPDAPHLVIPDE